MGRKPVATEAETGTMHQRTRDLLLPFCHRGLQSHKRRSEPAWPALPTAGRGSRCSAVITLHPQIITFWDGKQISGYQDWESSEMLQRRWKWAYVCKLAGAHVQRPFTYFNMCLLQHQTKFSKGKKKTFLVYKWIRFYQKSLFTLPPMDPLFRSYSTIL